MKRARGRGGGGKAGSVGMATAAKAGGTLRRRGEDTRYFFGWVRGEAAG